LCSGCSGYRGLGIRNGSIFNGIIASGSIFGNDRTCPISSVLLVAEEDDIPNQDDSLRHLLFGRPLLFGGTLRLLSPLWPTDDDSTPIIVRTFGSIYVVDKLSRRLILRDIDHIILLVGRTIFNNHIRGRRCLLAPLICEIPNSSLVCESSFVDDDVDDPIRTSPISLDEPHEQLLHKEDPPIVSLTRQGRLLFYYPGAATPTTSTIQSEGSSVSCHSGILSPYQTDPCCQQEVLISAYDCLRPHSSARRRIYYQRHHGRFFV
jgi:hypothetical protein